MKSKKLGIINKKSKKNGVKYNKKTNKLKKTSKLKRKKNLKRKLTLKKRGNNLKKIIKGGNPDEIETFVANISTLFENDTNLDNFYNLDIFIRNLGINENKDNLFINNDSTSNDSINKIFKSEFKKEIKEKKELNEKISNENNAITLEDNKNEKIKGIYTGEVGLVFVLNDKTIKFSQNYDDATTFCNKLEGKTDNKERGKITLKLENLTENEFKNDISFPDIFNILDNIFKYSDIIKRIEGSKEESQEGIKEESKEFVKIFPYSTMREQTPNDNVKEKITKMVEYRKQEIIDSSSSSSLPKRFNKIWYVIKYKITTQIYKELKKKLPYDSIIRHSRKIDTTTDLLENYDILCCLADILLTLKQFEKLKELGKNGGGKEVLGLSEITMCDTFLNIEKTQDDMGTKYYPIIDRVDKDYNEYSEGNIVQDCGFNEIIIQRILKKFYDKEIETKEGNKSYKIIDFKDFKLLFKKANDEYQKKKLQEIAEEGEKKEHPIGIKGNLISMESCEFKVKFNNGNKETFNNLSKLVRYCLLEINDYQKGEQFIFKLIEKLGLKNFSSKQPNKKSQFNLFNELLQEFIPPIKESSINFEKEILTIKKIDNLKDLDLKSIKDKIFELFDQNDKIFDNKKIANILGIQYNDLKKYQKNIQNIIKDIYKKYKINSIKKKLIIEDDSYFGLLKELNKNVGFIHGDHKCANIFITKKNEIPYNSGEKKSDCEFNINDIENYGIFDKICFVVADLDKSRCQIQKETFKGFNNEK